MILKILDYRKSENQSCEYEEWNYFDNIVSVSNYFDEETKMATVRCRFRDDNVVTFAIPFEAYLMSDTGKTIDKFYTKVQDLVGDADKSYERLQDAVAVAMAD